MPMIPEDEIERIKQTTDLAAVIRARGVELKPAGQDLVGLCPFHEDHDPSLRVTPGKGLWRCMSCGATGNVIQFVQRFDGVSFRHAFELLKGGAAFTGAPSCAPVKKASVPRLPAPVAVDADDQAALRQVLDYYHERLKENPAALAYLKRRGIGAEAVEAFSSGRSSCPQPLTRAAVKNACSGATDWRENTWSSAYRNACPRSTTSPGVAGFQATPLAAATSFFKARFSKKPSSSNCLPRTSRSEASLSFFGRDLWTRLLTSSAVSLRLSRFSSRATARSRCFARFENRSIMDGSTPATSNPWAVWRMA